MIFKGKIVVYRRSGQLPSSFHFLLCFFLLTGLASRLSREGNGRIERLLSRPTESVLSGIFLIFSACCWLFLNAILRPTNVELHIASFCTKTFVHPVFVPLLCRLSRGSWPIYFIATSPSTVWIRECHFAVVIIFNSPVVCARDLYLHLCSFPFFHFFIFPPFCNSSTGAANPSWEELNYHPEVTVGKGKARSAEEERQAQEIDRILRDKVLHCLSYCLIVIYPADVLLFVLTKVLFTSLIHLSRCFWCCVLRPSLLFSITRVSSFRVFIHSGILSQCIQQSDGGQICGCADLRRC